MFTLRVSGHHDASIWAQRTRDKIPRLLVAGWAGNAGRHGYTQVIDGGTDEKEKRWPCLFRGLLSRPVTCIFPSHRLVTFLFTVIEWYFFQN